MLKTKPRLIEPAEYSRLVDAEVYPGQPLLLALFILKLYPKASDAFQPTSHGWPHAVGNSSVPGSGDMVHNAVDVLRFHQTNRNAEQTIAHAHELWKRSVGPGSTNHPSSYEPGLLQAKALEQEFTTLLNNWNWN
jgi:hypothetical protein